MEEFGRNNFVSDMITYFTPFTMINGIFELNFFYLFRVCVDHF